MTSSRILVYSVLATLFANASGYACCICGETATGSCYEPGVLNRRTMENKYTCGELHNMGLNQELNAGPCGIAQAWAFSSGTTGCSCPVDNRPIKTTPECSTCAEDEIQDVYDSNGNVKWFYFTAGALSCKDIYGFARDGFIPQTICQKTVSEVLENGCCGTISGSNPDSMISSSFSYLTAFSSMVTYTLMPPLLLILLSQFVQG